MIFVGVLSERLLRLVLYHFAVRAADLRDLVFKIALLINENNDHADRYSRIGKVEYRLKEFVILPVP